MQFIEAVSELH